MHMTEESDLRVNEIAWELAEVVHLRLFFFFFLKGKKAFIFVICLVW